jgi:hypothetical protein
MQRELWGTVWKRKWEGQGQVEGSLSPTREECGRAFAPRASKGDFQVSKGVICYVSKREKDVKRERRNLRWAYTWGVTTCTPTRMYLC